jgi:hypothetical protein
MKASDPKVRKLVQWAIDRAGSRDPETVSRSLSCEGLRDESLPEKFREAVTAFRHLNTADRLRKVRGVLKRPPGVKEKQVLYAAMFKVTIDGKTTYFVQGNDQRKVHAFEDMRAGLDYFERGYNEAIARGYGFAAGAMLNYINLQPKVFRFGTRKRLVELLGETSNPYSLTATGVFEVGFKCLDQAAAARVYEKATEPRLVPA